jgi:heat shock protein HslJ
MTRFAPLSLLPILVLLVGCQPPAGEEPAPVDEASTPGPPTLEELRNAAYRVLEEPDGPITLVDGRWEGEPYEAGGASRPEVTLVGDFHVLGDLDGDGTDEAVVLLAESSGGSGTRSHLAVVARRGSGLENVGTTPLGDRVQLRAARIEGGRLVVDVVRAGPDDPACCPGELATQGLTLTADGLKPFDAATPQARLSLETVAGVEWVLRAWTFDEPAPDEPEITLRYLEGRFAGRSACNRYFAPVEEGELPGAIEVGLGAGTMMACPDPEGAMEARFLKLLGRVNRYGFTAGQLMLSYEADGGRGVLLFDGREAPGDP